MNSIENCDVLSILDEVFQILDEIHIKQTIDTPIKMTAAEFDAGENERITFHSFLCITGDFIKEVFQLKIFCSQQLSDDEAQSEAVAILDSYYKNIQEDGLMAAYLDTLNAEIDGIEFIIAQLTAILIKIARDKYTGWIVSSKISCLDWSVKCEIVKTIMAQNDRYLPSDIKNCPPGILTARLHDLIQLVVVSESTAQEYLSNHLCTVDDRQSIEIETSDHVLPLSFIKSLV